MYGYAGKIASIDLSSKVIDSYLLQEGDLEQFLGGKSLAAKIIFDSLNSKVEAFSEENIIVITTSPLTGSSAPCSSRFNVSTISPLTGLLVSSNCGGNFGLKLKSAGYDGLVISGKSSESVYLEINSGEIQIKSASHLWGKSTSETQELLGDKSSGKFVIGPAGENMVRYAAVFSEERVAGRGGVGAVFGFKNLKGLIADGQLKAELFNRKGLKKLNRGWIKHLRNHKFTGERFPQYGTAGILAAMNSLNQLATKNYSAGSFDDYEKISGETLTRDYLLKSSGCLTCPIRCARVVEAFGKEIKGPELETLGLLGSNLLNSDMLNIIRVNYLCDEYGLDTISFGSSVGMAMELNEKGLWDNGLNFGDPSPLEELVEKVAMREDIGDDLAEGTKRMAQKFGGSAFAINAKGLELAAYEPRAAQGMGLGYATSNRGGCHLNGGYLVVLEGLGLRVNGRLTRGKAAYTIFFQDLMEAASAGGSCIFTTYALLPNILVKNQDKIISRIASKIAPYLGGIVGFLHNNIWLLNFNIKALVPYPCAIKQVTGFKITIGSFIKAGERGFNLERIINIRQGLKKSDDALPDRLTKELQVSDDALSRVNLKVMLKDYYKLRGWDDDGVPTPDTLKKLNL